MVSIDSTEKITLRTTDSVQYMIVVRCQAITQFKYIASR